MKIQQILRGTIFAGLFIIPFTPLFVTNSYLFPFITGKAFYFRAVVEVITAAWLALCLYDSSARPKKSWLTWTLVGFTVFILIADIYGANPFKSIWSNYERMEGWVTIVHLLCYYLVATTMIRTKDLWNRLLGTSVGVSVVVMLFSFAQWLGWYDVHQGSTRLDATLGNSEYLAVYMLTHVFFTALLTYRLRHNVYAKYGLPVIGLLQLVILYGTLTRGAMVGLVFGLFVVEVLAVIFEKEIKLVRRIAGALVILELVLVGSLYLARHTQFVTSHQALGRFASVFTLEAYAPRFAIWNMALQGAHDRPLLGWGQENFNYVFNKYYNPSMYAQEQWFDRAHNVFLDWLVAAGIPGLAGYVSLFVLCLIFVWRRGTVFSIHEKIILTGLLTAYWLFTVSVFDNLISYIAFFTLLAFVDASRERPSSAVLEHVRIHPDISHLILAPACGIALVVALYYVDIRPMTSSTNLIGAISTHNVQDSLAFFKKSLSVRTTGEQETREQLMTTTTRVVGANNIQDSVKKDFLKFTQDQMQLQFAYTPNDARLYQIYANVMSNARMYDAAVAALAKAHELSPAKQAISADLAIALINVSQDDAALALTKNAYEAEPRYKDAQMAYGIALLLTGHTKQAHAQFADLISKSPELATDQRLINAYLFVKDYDTLATIYAAIYAKDPHNVQTGLSLAAVYLKQGYQSRSIAQLKVVANDNPDVADQVAQYIKQIQEGKIQ